VLPTVGMGYTKLSQRTIICSATALKVPVRVTHIANDEKSRHIDGSGIRDTIDYTGMLMRVSVL
jgi:hypothetical protein